MTATKKLFNIINKNNGYITTNEVSRANIARRLLSELLAKGKIVKATRGIYTFPHSFEDEMYFIQSRFKKGIFSHSPALYLHSLTDKTPHSFVMTFPFGYNVNSAKKAGIAAKVASKKFYEDEIVEVKTNFGNLVKVYNLERTLCDIARANSGEDIQVITQVFKSYAVLKHKNIGKLIKYAKALRVFSKVSSYLEVLL